MAPGWAALATSGDQIQPGDTELTLILDLAMSRAIVFVRISMAPLDAAYVHLGTKDHIQNNSFSGPNKLECYITLGLKSLPETNTLAYRAHS